jgi:hypothetical protein
MVGDQLKTSTVASALGHVVGDLTDLVQKEMRLAQAEFSANLSAKLEGGVWLAAAAFLAGIAFLLSRPAECLLSRCSLTLLGAQMRT